MSNTNNVTLTFTPEERDEMIGWAGMAAVGFVFGGTTNPHDPGVTALKKLEASRDEEE